MNVRVYDPVLGRFLSPDPVTQDPSNTQNFDRFSYVLNNPLKYTDPSGYKRRYRKLNRIKRDPSNNSYWRNFDEVMSGAYWQVMANIADGFIKTETETGVLGGGAPSCGSASGPGSGGSGTHGGFSPDGGDDGEIYSESTDLYGYDIKYTLINNSKNTIWYKPDKGNDWDAIPLRPGESICTPVDAIYVGGTVYKISNGYNYVIVNESNKILFDYSWYVYPFPLECMRLIQNGFITKYTIQMVLNNIMSILKAVINGTGIHSGGIFSFPIFKFPILDTNSKIHGNNSKNNQLF